MPETDPILEAARNLETVRLNYEKVVNEKMPDDLEDRIAWRAKSARLSIDLNKADADFSTIVDAERRKAMRPEEV